VAVHSLTTFRGRAAEIADVVRLLSGARLVTLTGTPGIGKTRLASASAAAARLETFSCDLSACATAADVERAVASGIGATRFAEDPSVVPARLRSLGRACVILDDCGGAREHVASALVRWSSAAEQVTFLATSRALLEIDGEQTYEVPPLSLEDACALFADRARLVRHDWDASTEADAVAEIARKLDGIPLAIELAAARMSVMSASTLLSKLDDAFSVLDRADRARRLQRALETMTGMLAPQERTALVRLAAFRGAFDVGAACDVLETGRGADLVQSLKERSLVRLVAVERFALYAIVRQFALAQLAPPAERDAALAAHERLMVARAERWLEPGPGRLGRAGLAALAEMVEDLRVVFERLDGETPARTGPLLASALAWHSVLHARGELGRGREVLDRALAKAGDAAGHERSLALALAFRVLHQRAQMTPLEAATARADCQRARTLAAGDDWIEALAVCALGYVAVQSGDDEAIARLLPEAIAMQQSCGDREGEMRTQRLLGTILVNQGRATEGMRHFERALAIARDVDPASVAIYSGMIGCVHLGAGRLDQAVRALGEAAERIGVEGSLEGAHFAAYLAVALQELGRHDEADARYRAAVETSRRYGDTKQLAITIHYWGTLAYERGDFEGAVSRYREALSHYAGGTREIATCTRAALAAALARLGRLSEAKAELAEAMHACRELGPLWKNVARAASGHVALAESTDDRVIERQRALLAALAAPTNEDVRFAERALRERLDALACDLVIGPSSAWFERRGGPRVSLERRKVLRALLETLATRAPIGSEELVAAIWPSERMSRSAGLNRVHVAVAQLRALGLEGLVLQESGRYRLATGFRRG